MCANQSQVRCTSGGGGGGGEPSREQSQNRGLAGARQAADMLQSMQGALQRACIYILYIYIIYL